MSRIIDKVDILGGILHRIGNFNPSNFNSNFSDRLILQKTIYLMQAFGLQIGYGYNWYLRGPYSPALTRDAYKLIEKYDTLPTIRFVSSESEDIFSKFLDFIERHKTNGEWLEILASIHFLYRNSFNKNKENIWTKVKSKKSNLKKGRFDTCWNELVQIGLIGDDNF